MTKVASFYFDSGSYVLTPASVLAMYSTASTIAASGKHVVLVYGNTDAKPGMDNMILSMLRAQAVQAFLQPLLPTQNLLVGWYAATRPAASGNSSASDALNRRVEIWVLNS